jgi:N-sulfoglucosamine sulfohydrolase
VPEELYDYEHDPAALHNLIDDPAYADVLKELREEMQRIMETSHDPLLELFQRREDAAFVSAEIDALQAEADARGGKRKNAPQANRQSQGKKPPQNQQLRQNK